VGSVVVFLLVLFTLNRWDASTTSYQLLPMPIVTVIAAAILRGEAITPGLIVGGAIVLVGVYLGVFVRPRDADDPDLGLGRAANRPR